MPTLDEIADHPERIDEVSPEGRNRLILRCATVMAALARNGGSAGDRAISLRDAAVKMAVSESWLYKHANELPFGRHAGGRWVFSERGIEQWLEGKR
jgi:predicted DNA-binding transcriptional regulator AlpA